MSVVDSAWIDIGAVDDVPVRGSRVIKAGGTCIAIFRTADGQLFAIEDACPHQRGPLSQGIVHGNSVTCPLHNWIIDLSSGQAQGADEGQVPTIGLLVEAGRIFIDPASLANLKAA
jgi:nitrite reductase (NADH) small subunit